MRILIEPSGYKLGNLGDAAMLAASVERLRALWPDAELAAVTRAPDALARLCRGVEPLDASARGQFLRAAAVTPLPLLLRDLCASQNPLGRFAAFFDAADLVFFSGAGGFNDAFRDHALSTLELLALAQRNGKPTVLVGQGLGPWSDPELRARAEELLPRASALFLREKRLGGKLLEGLGADWLLTGDDALEEAYRARPDALGAAIGVNLRLADYSGVPPEAVGKLGEALRELGRRLGAPLLPVPISHPPNSSDPEAIAALLGGDGGAELADSAAVIAQIARCRLVVTGSYHAAVFALAQGIPAVGLAASPYYRGKFEGLHDLFGPSCMPATLDNPQRLIETAISLWEQAEARRPELLREAERQIAAGLDAYRSLPERIGPRFQASSQAQEPAVSVIVPVFNQAELLRDCLESVRRQTRPDWEAIVVDDGSSQGDPAAVVASLADPRIRLTRHQRNRGLAAARNTGFEQARAEWVLPLDADDLLEPVCLEALLDLARREPSADALFGRLRYFGARTGVWLTQAQDAEAFLARKRMPGAGTMWRKTLWQAAGGYCEEALLRGGQEDTDFWLSAFAAGARAAHDPRPLYWYRRHESSMTGTISKDYHRIRELLHRRHRDLIDRLERPGQFLADGYWRAALSRWRAGRKAAAMVFLARATWAARRLPGPAPSGAELRRELASGHWYHPAYQRSHPADTPESG